MSYCVCFSVKGPAMGSAGGDTAADPEENEEFTPFRLFTRDSLFNIERRIAEESAAKVRIQLLPVLLFVI